MTFIRLGLYLPTAARGSDLPRITTAKMLEHQIAGYEQAFEVQSDSPAFSGTVGNRSKSLCGARRSDHGSN
jgi:uncharacterized protein (DUF2252 family)